MIGLLRTTAHKVHYYIDIAFYGEPICPELGAGEYCIHCEEEKFPGLNKDGEQEIARAKELLEEYAKNLDDWEGIKFLGINKIDKG